MKRIDLLHRIQAERADYRYLGERTPNEGEEHITTATEALVRWVEGFNSGKLNPRLNWRNHSPTGFNWGYGGSGSAQLALAILADFTGDKDFTLRHYQDFKRDFLATSRMSSASRFEIAAGEIIAWIRIQPLDDGET